MKIKPIKRSLTSKHTKTTNRLKRIFLKKVNVPMPMKMISKRTQKQMLLVKASDTYRKRNERSWMAVSETKSNQTGLFKMV